MPLILKKLNKLFISQVQTALGLFINPKLHKEKTMLKKLFKKYFKLILVTGESMYPTLKDNQYVLVKKTKKISRGDIILFRWENRFLIKRIIALSEDRLCSNDRGVFLNDYKLNEYYVSTHATHTPFECKIPHYHVFVMGDNRLDSVDSRHPLVGNVRLDTIVGKVLLRFPNIF